MKHYVIIGNGVAAAGVIEGIRHVDGEGTITVVSAEKHGVYCRPLISYYLEGKAKLSHMGYRPPDFYEQNRATVLYGKQAVKLDAGAKTVLLDDGTGLPYDALCVAAGSSPFVPGFAGLETVPVKQTFMTLDDALALEKAVSGNSRVLIVGAGLIGLKCAEGLSGRVNSITVCDLAERVLPSILDGEAAALVQAKLETRRIQFLLADSAVRFDGNQAFMKSGKTVAFDVLVLAVGVRPNTQLVQDAGGAVNRGIQTDVHMRTTLPEVYAAGDCVACFDVSSGENRVLAILPNAYMQGRCAGASMAGADALFDCAMPMNAIGFFGLHILTAGSYPGEAEGGTVYEARTGDTLKRLYLQGGRLKGFMLIGCIDRAGIYTRLIREQTPLDTLDFALMKKNPALFPLGREYRSRILEGVV